MERKENFFSHYRSHRMTWQEAADKYDDWTKRRRTARQFAIEGKNTFLEYDPQDNTYDIRLYRTIVVKIWPGDIYQIFTNGWTTHQTFACIGTFSPARLSVNSFVRDKVRRRETMVTVNKWKNSIFIPDFGPETIKFYEGIKVNANRDLITGG